MRQKNALEAGLAPSRLRLVSTVRYRTDLNGWMLPWEMWHFHWFPAESLGFGRSRRLPTSTCCSATASLCSSLTNLPLFWSTSSSSLSTYGFRQPSWSRGWELGSRTLDRSRTEPRHVPLIQVWPVWVSWWWWGNRTGLHLQVRLPFPRVLLGTHCFASVAVCSPD